MKISVDFEIVPITIRVGSYPDPDLIKEKLVEYLGELLKVDAPPFSQNPELWIDISDDGEGQCNVYQIKISE